MIRLTVSIYACRPRAFGAPRELCGTGGSIVLSLLTCLSYFVDEATKEAMVAEDFLELILFDSGEQEFGFVLCFESQEHRTILR